MWKSFFRILECCFTPSRKKQKEYSQDPTERLKKIVGAYGDCVLQHGERLMLGVAEKVLPYPKGIIQDAIENLYRLYGLVYKSNQNREMKHYLLLLEFIYGYLAYFLPDNEVQFQKGIKGYPAHSVVEYKARISKRQDYYIERFNKLKEQFQ